MILSDKQSLRKCVKQIVRHAEIVDIAVFNPFEDDFGLSPMLGSFPGGAQLGRADQPTPITEGAAALYAAFDAVGISLSSLEDADTLQKSYSREAWLREILDVMPAKRVFIEVPMNASRNPSDMDNRFLPVLRVDPEQVQVGRYGISLENEAARIFETSVRLGTRQIKLNGYREDFLRYCLLPMAEDRDLVLHLSIETAKDAERFLRTFRQFPAAHCVLYPAREAETYLIHAVRGMARLLVSVTTPQNVDAAFSELGFSFLPQASFSTLPEEMLGRWIQRREQIHEILSDHYLPLARAGYELSDEIIEADIGRLFSGNFLTFCGIEP
ncbi:MAG: hypothetical protein IJT77_08635 [Clostridia bacterium]|nr:hypothetical protein [Clostridia bacterium]